MLTQKVRWTSRCEPEFLPLIESQDAALLESADVCAYGLWPDMTLAFLNPGWFQFASMNGGEPAISLHWTLGRSALDAAAGPLKPFIERGYRRCLAEGRPWTHCYECSSADQNRWFNMLCYPLVENRGLLVVHSRKIEQPHGADREPQQADLAIYADSHGFIHQCSYCRRVRTREGPQTWEWVPTWVESPPASTSHGICEPCFAHYFSKWDDDDLKLPFTLAD